MRAQRAKSAGVGAEQAGLFGAVAQPIRVYRCECGADAHYGLSYPLAFPDQWFCRRCLPVNFLPQQRSDAA